MKLFHATAISALAALSMLGCAGSGQDAAPADATADAQSDEADAPADGAMGDHHAGEKAAEGETAAEGEAAEVGEAKQGFDELRAAGNPRDVDGWRLFGADFTLTESLAASAVLASAADHEGKTVRMEGTVADVCNKMGCWLVVQAGEETIRVTMKEHAFGIDRDCAGKTASLEGILQSKAVDPKMVEHLESESDNPDAMPEKGKDKVWEIIASSIALKAAA